MSRILGLLASPSWKLKRLAVLLRLFSEKPKERWWEGCALTKAALRDWWKSQHCISAECNWEWTYQSTLMVSPLKWFTYIRWEWTYISAAEGFTGSPLNFTTSNRTSQPALQCWSATLSSTEFGMHKPRLLNIVGVATGETWWNHGRLLISHNLRLSTKNILKYCNGFI